MKILLLALVLSSSSVNAFATKTCTCKCVVKENGKYSTQEASGKDREEAGEKLKKALDKNTCELTPTCTGNCDSDKP